MVTVARLGAGIKELSSWQLTVDRWQVAVAVAAAAVIVAAITIQVAVVAVAAVVAALRNLPAPPPSKATKTPAGPQLQQEKDQNILCSAIVTSSIRFGSETN